MDCEYVTWLYVISRTKESARVFFDLPNDWPCYSAGLSFGSPKWKLLSPAFLKQKGLTVSQAMTLYERGELKEI